MKERFKKNINAVAQLLRQFHDDWLNFDEIHIATYGGSYRWYPGKKENDARWAAWEKRDEERRRLAYLKRKRWVETKKTAKGLLVKLTDEGIMERLRRTLHERPKLKAGTVCLVLFDIPESVRHSRDAFRHFLKSSDFRQEQRSVWLSGRDVSKEVLRFVRRAKIGKWVSVFVGKMER